jgi:hypothetical protein
MKLFFSSNRINFKLWRDPFSFHRYATSYELSAISSHQNCAKENQVMKSRVIFFLLTLLLTTALQIRLSHENKRGYSYNISGPSVEEVIETDQKMRQYLRSLAPKKNTGPAPSAAVPKPAPAKK